MSYETAGSDWKLTVSDNGVGKTANDTPTTGLGTAIVEALVKQSEARMDVISDADGTSVSMTGRRSPRGCRGRHENPSEGRQPPA
ncbi:hypothetical protein [Mesorhizobium sp. LMG17149]|uniref:hypothetical protein n=1 Tax=Mesorhizobium sp. LMG17149 TaxID=2968497 RepID=UPI003556504B